MATANAVPFEQASEDLCTGVHNLASDTLKVFLTNDTPNHATHSVKADLTEISAGNGYPAGGLSVTVSSASQTGGVFTLVGDVDNLNASGGSVGPFRYAVLYNDSSASNSLLASWDYGSSITPETGESVNITEPGGSLFTLTI